MSTRRLFVQVDGPLLHTSNYVFQLQPEVLHYLRRLTHEAGYELSILECKGLVESARETLYSLLTSESIPFAKESEPLDESDEQYNILDYFVVDSNSNFTKSHTKATIIHFQGKSQTGLERNSEWSRVFHKLMLPGRSAHVNRTTSETTIYVALDLDQAASAEIETGIGFFDHMLEQIARHADVSMVVQCKGDLHVDEHHTIEDVALALGQAFHDALGDKRGLQRYGFVLPMDEARAEVALDFSGRNWLVWEADFHREMVGKMPTEMFKHFFKSLTDTAKLTLHIKATGENEHHKIEAIFKGFGRALRMALKREVNNEIPSTKGSL